MGMETIASVYYFALYSLLDFILYVLVDIVAKSSLRGARDEEEKRLVWLYEAAFLLLLCLPIYLLHHMPWTLLLLTFFTFLYTQLQGRINFSYWRHLVVTRWEEFQQHEESMEHLQVMQSRQAQNPTQMQQMPPVSIPVSLPPVGWMPPPPPGFIPQPQMNYIPPPNMPKLDSCEPWYAEKSRMPNNVAPQLHHRNVPPTYSHPSTPPVYSNSPMYSTSSPMPVRYMPRPAQLVRRPLRSPLASPQKPVSEGQKFSNRIKTSVMSVFGYNPLQNPLPGLQNRGQNICFLNSVLQCLAHSPSLVDSLGFDSRLAKEAGGGGAPIVGVLAELMEHLATAPGGEKYAAFDTEELRMTASRLPGSLVVDPKAGGQSQQDAAEFLMWLLDALHTKLNCKRPFVRVNTSMAGQGPTMVERHPACPRSTAMTLNMLKFIYGDLSPPRFHELMQSCRTEIESANGLDGDSYAEPIQRLSDLEWLTYKDNNNSAVDDLFTGQLVEAQHCIACNRISVGIQSFNVLPVPIVEPRQLNGLVFLEDCFAKFCNIEDLFGAEGLCCETCNKVLVSTSTPVQRRTVDAAALTASPVLRNGGVQQRGTQLRPGSTSDSALHSTFGHTTVMSPIANLGDPVNDSGFQDNLFRTSTPIHGTVAPVAPVRLTDGQRRSLLRQLPECLIVQLMRFSYQMGQPHKLERPVNIPLVKLDLTHLIIDNVMKREDLTALNVCFRYDLYGVCLHLGSESTSCGHYVSYSQASDGHWYKFDDEIVTQVNMDYELNTRMVRENAYLLFYRKSVLV